MVDVFISRRMNNKNQRFGFVKFQGVVDVVDLERRLDSVWIGYWKVRANRPKFGRDREPRYVRKVVPKPIVRRIKEEMERRV